MIQLVSQSRSAADNPNPLNLPDSVPNASPNNAPSEQNVEIEDNEKEVESFTKKYIQFTEDQNFFVYIVRRPAEFVPGSLYDKEFGRGIFVRLGSLAANRMVNETIQEVKFDKTVHTLAQAHNWIRINVKPFAPENLLDSPDTPDRS